MLRVELSSTLLKYRAALTSALLCDLSDAPTALAACCGFDLCHKYILYLYLYLRGSCGSADQMACLLRPPDRGVLDLFVYTYAVEQLENPLTMREQMEFSCCPKDTEIQIQMQIQIQNILVTQVKPATSC